MTKKASYSLGTLLLVTALIASLAAVYLSQQENDALSKSNRRMANELSIFQISDATKVLWSEIESPAKMMWRFRLYVPPGKKMQINYYIGPSTEEIPTSMRLCYDIVEGSDELQTISIQFRQVNATFMKIEVFKNGDSDHSRVLRNPEQFAWLQYLDSVSVPYSRDTADVNPALGAPDENVILLRKTQSIPSAGGTWTTDDPPNQFLIWLEPLKRKTSSLPFPKADDNTMHTKPPLGR